MSSVEINGGSVVYEILGEEDGIPAVLTPGGRAPRGFLRSLGERLAESGMKVLIWDRPNGGESDIQFSDRWPTESHMHADTLQQLIKHLAWGPTIIVGASAGARVSIITALQYPEVTRGLFLWHIAGGIYPTLALGNSYIVENIAIARKGGVEAVTQLPHWKQRIEQNPRNKERFEALSDEEFIRTLKLWLSAFVPTPGQVIPGVRDDDIASIAAPTVIIRSGQNDEEHPLLTCYSVHALIRGSRVVEPPWAEDAWEKAFANTLKTGGPNNAFDLNAQAAPLILDLARTTTADEA
ncbi:alpha/beta fold hydrolase [Streptomyces sp. NPDC091280]|uniref:alpha/beta fold hydrolase n=1 Tax=Streptomyces sp. NPDC091280 TaxID=3365984 RepID=UPI0038086AB6